ncbi:MAG: DinB family protein [Syntrophaceae bacterium]|nr:DinB family protein [Syntrophaceae bacterium]
MLKEVEAYLAKLGDLRNQAKTLLEGLPPEALDWRPIQGEGELATNSLAVLAVHLAGSQTYWMKEIIGRTPIHRDREAEFTAKGIGVAAMKAKLDAAGKVAEDVLSSLTESQLAEGRMFRDKPITVRGGILQVLDHFSQHIGHMQLTRQLWMTKDRK